MHGFPLAKKTGNPSVSTLRLLLRESEKSRPAVSMLTATGRLSVSTPLQVRKPQVAPLVASMVLTNDSRAVAAKVVKMSTLRL